MTIEIKDGIISHCVVPDERLDFNETMSHIHYSLRDTNPNTHNDVLKALLKYHEYLFTFIDRNNIEIGTEEDVIEWYNKHYM